MTKRNGRPPYKPNDRDRQTVSVMVAAGIQQENIARCIGENGVDLKTLKKYYKEELETSADKANAKVAQSLFQQATNGNTSAAIWWSKSRKGWKETVKNENENSGDLTINIKRFNGSD